MKNLTIHKSWESWFKVVGITLLSGSMLLAVSGCDDGYRVRSAGVYSSSHSYYDPFDYFYYPSSRVYFNIASGNYYYPDGRYWRHVRKLPPRYHLDRRDRIRVRVKSDRPYIKHHDHIKHHQNHPTYRYNKQHDRGERDNNYRRHKEYRENHRRHR